MNRMSALISIVAMCVILHGCTNESVEEVEHVDHSPYMVNTARRAEPATEGWDEYQAELQEEKLQEKEDAAMRSACRVFEEAHAENTYDIAEMNIEKNPVGSGYFFWKEPITHARSGQCKIWCWMVVGETTFHLSLESQVGVKAYWPNEMPEIWASTNLPEDFRIDGGAVGATRKAIDTLK